MPGDARGWSWPPFERGHERSMVHGAQSDRKLRPIVDELLAGLEACAAWTSLPAFTPIRERWAWAEAQAILYREHFDTIGLGEGDDEPPAGLDRWDRAEARAAKAAGELGLTPLALTRLLAGLSSIDAPAAQQGLDALRKAGAELATAARQRALTAVPDGDGGGAA